MHITDADDRVAVLSAQLAESAARVKELEQQVRGAPTPAHPPGTQEMDALRVQLAAALQSVKVEKVCVLSDFCFRCSPRSS